MSSEKAFVSRSYMALWLLEKFWCKPQNGQLAPKSQIFKMVGNHHGAQFHMWGQNSNACNIYRKGNFIRINTVLRTRVQKWTNFKLLMGSRRDMFLKVVAFLLKIVKIWKNDLKQNRSNCLTKTFAIIYFQYNVYYSCSIMFNFMG